MLRNSDSQSLIMHIRRVTYLKRMTICYAENNARVAREQSPPIGVLYKTHIFRHALRVLLVNGLLPKNEFLRCPLKKHRKNALARQNTKE